VRFKSLPALDSIAMAVTEAKAMHDGTEVETIDTESHRGKEMRHIRYLDGEHEGATRWVFEGDLE